MAAIDSILLDAFDADKPDLREFLTNPRFDLVVVGDAWVEDGSLPGFLANVSHAEAGDGSAHGFQDFSTFNTGTGNSQYNSFYARAALTGTKNYNHIRSFQSYVRSETTGTVDEMQTLISWPVVTAGVVTDLNHVELAAAQVSGGGTVWHEVAIKIGGTPAPTVDCHAIYSTWDWPLYLEGGLGMANNRYLSGKNAAGALCNLIGIDNVDDVYLVNSGIAGRIYVGRPLFTIASAAGNAGFRIPHGAAPSSPVDGDEWSTTTGRFCRLNGVTKQFTLT